MRLGQLSRKVNTKPSTILSYLNSEFDIKLGTHLNTKVDDALVDKVIERFMNGSNIAFGENKAERDSNILTTNDFLIEKEAEHEQTAAVTEEMDKDSENQDTPENTELIEVPKIELSGLKIVGKIELPPSLEEQMVEVDGVMISKADLARKRKEEKLRKRKHKANERKHSVHQARKKRVQSEEHIEQLKREQEVRRLAESLERREKRITAKLKAQRQMTKQLVIKHKKRPRKKQVEPEAITTVEVMPTTWYGKLWRWFNT